MESKRILITGANGLVGGLLAKFLAADHDIVALDGSKQLDLTNATAVDAWFDTQQHFDVVLHCAARGTEDVQSEDTSIYYDNLAMFENLKNNQQHFSRFINFASGCELTPVAERTESSLLDYLPRTPYGLSKNLIAREVLKHDNWYNLRIFGLATYTRVFKNVAEAAAQGATTFDLTDRYMDYLYEYQLEYLTRLYIETDANLVKDINLVPVEKHKVSDYVNGYISRMKLNIKLNIVAFNDEAYTGDATYTKRMNVI